MLRRVKPSEVAPIRRAAVDADAMRIARDIIEDVRARGMDAVRAHAERLGDVERGCSLVLGRAEMEAAVDSLDGDDLAALREAADRIRAFADKQAASLSGFDMPIEGGVARQVIAPVERAGCYAPGGRFPLPSSVLMTALAARAAGVGEVWVASPNPAPATLAAAAIAGADGLLACGGAQAIAAMTYGAGEVPACDAIVGPGNRYVTAAKQLVAGHVAIDMLAGPSEVLVIVDDSADAGTIAADLLAQAEHDVDASVVLVSLSAGLVDRVDAELSRQIETLPTGEIASAALAGSYACVVGSEDEAVEIADRVAPEHLEVMTEDAAALAARLSHYGALFVGRGAAEAVGDYGVGPNHVLPTGGTARSFGGLSPLTFMRVRTVLEMDDAPAAVYERAARLARIEGLEAHARSAEARL